MIGGPVTAVGVGLNPTRVGVLNVLAQAGAKMQIVQRADQSGEPSGDVRIERPAHLKPFSISGSQVPAVIDEIPILSVLATQCEGTTTIRGAQELRVKESDRIDAVASGLRAMGAEVEVFEDGMSISGPAALKAAVIDAKRDHRLAMAFAMAGMIAEGETVIEGAETINTSFPNFEMELRRLSGD
jgi:3-phosphoshikimate 1-carboxyvinyltransferase